MTPPPIASHAHKFGPPTPARAELGLFARAAPVRSGSPAPEQEPRLLLIEADEVQAAQTAARFADHGLSVTVAATPESAEAQLAARAYDLVVIEPRLEGRDGLTFCRDLAARTRAPLMIFSADDDPLDRVAGLEFGADDYLGKSAHPLELLARVRALLRRGARDPRPLAPARPPAYVFQGLRFEPRSRALIAPGGEKVWLTTAEAGLLQVFVSTPGEVLSRAQVQARLFGSDVHLSDRAIDVRVVRLRRAFDRLDVPGADLVRTCRGGGYLLAAEVAVL